MTLRGAYNKFPDFFHMGIWAFKIVMDSWKFTVIAIHIMRWPTNFFYFRFKWIATAEIGIQPTNCQSWGISKMQSNTLEEGYAVKFCFRLGKKATETYGMPQTAFGPCCMNRALVFEWHKRFKEGRESVRDDERCGRSKEVNTPELIGQRVTMLRLGLVCWGFKGVQEEIPREEASTLQIGSVAFPPGQCTSPQLYPHHRLFDGHQDSSSASL